MTTDPKRRLAALEEWARDTGSVDLVDVLDLYDSLPAVPTAVMLGGWRGGGLATGHRLDGLLEALGWHGKRCDGADDVHPLVLEDGLGTFCVDPGRIPLGPALHLRGLARAPAGAAVGRRALRALATRRSTARLREIRYRGVVSTALVYDALPVIDHFREVDDDTILGIMDLRGEAPFAFVLRRELSS